MAARIFGQESLEDLGNAELQRIQSRNIPIPPNFNKILKVPDMDDGDVRFFTEVEDRKPEDPLIIYLHGGGYSYGMSQGQTQTLTELYNQIPAKERLSVVWIDYTLSPSKPFPQQLIEVANTYSTLQETSKKIILMGDSSGGHLALSLMRHIHTPFSGVPEIPNAKKPIAAVLVSPWLQLLIDTPVAQGSSYDRYRTRDVISVPGLNFSGRLVLREDVWPGCQKMFAEMYNDTSIPWSDVLPNKKKVLTTAGEIEILRDSIEQFYSVSGLKAGGGTLYIEPNGVHDTPAVLGPDRSGVTGIISQFLRSVISGSH